MRRALLVFSTAVAFGVGVRPSLADEPLPGARPLEVPAQVTQSAQANERRVEVRVTFASADSVYLDQGENADIHIGDLVTLISGARGHVEARIVALSSNSSRAKMVDGKRTPAVGARGTVVVAARSADDVARGEDEGPKRAPEHPEWTAAIPDRDPDAPLLAPAFLMRAHERAATFRGRVRVQMLIDEDRNGDRDATFSLYRGGLDLDATNVFGRGGLIEFSGELTRRVSEIGGLDDETEDDLRIDRLSYRWGQGFDSPLVVAVGRFMPRDTPEFGLVDGAEASFSVGEFGRITLNGGALPEPSADRKTFDDLSASVAWRWRDDERERLVTVLALQQTWHEGDADRRLVLARADWSPTDSVTLHGDTWLDIYDSQDEIKGEGIELTEARGSAVWNVTRDHGLRASASYARFPELLRYEFDDVAARFLENNEVFRAGVGGWHRLHENVRVDERVGIWSDQDDDGVTADLGLRFPDVILPRNEPALRVFRIDAATEDGFGVRVSDRHTFADLSFALAWETSWHDFELSGDTRTRQAVAATVDVYWAEEWSLSVETDYRFGDDQDAVSLSVYLEYRF